MKTIAILLLVSIAFHRPRSICLGVPTVPFSHGVKYGEDIDDLSGRLIVRPYLPMRPADYQGMQFTMTYSGTHRAFVYLNGVYLGYSNDNRSHQTLTGWTGMGDVFAITGYDTVNRLRGVIAHLRIGGRYEAKTRHLGGFKVANRMQMARDGKYWKFRTLPKNYCMWENEPRVIYNSSKPEKEAEYVWDNNGLQHSLVWLRYVVGGEACNVRQQDPGTQTCYCEEDKREEKGDCYKFVNDAHLKTFQEKHRCEKHECAPSYHCVDDSARQSGMRCMKKFIRAEVRKASLPSSPTLKCVQANVLPPRLQLAPYL